MKKIFLLFALAELCAGAAFGQRGTFVGGLEWANTNVAQPNTFAPRADMYTEIYQWNRLTAWSITGNVSGWHSANYDDSPAWTVNPCPDGWRLPTPAEFKLLSNAGSTWANANTRGNAVNGRFYGTNHAACTLPDNMNSCIFLPAVGSRFNSGEVNGHTRCGMYWANAQRSPFNGIMLHFEDSKSPVSDNSKGRGVPVRCVRGSYTVINGLKWADTNVDDFQQFALRPDVYTKFYQWNRATAYSATNPLLPAWATPDNSATWTNNPCPDGWRLPTFEEYQALNNLGNTWAGADTRGNAVAGRFYGANHAACTLPNNMENCVFFPAVGSRNYSSGMLFSQGNYGYYWSATESAGSNGYFLNFYNTSSSPNITTDKANGMSVRCVQVVQ